jgi:hypothetical protein
MTDRDAHREQDPRQLDPEVRDLVLSAIGVSQEHKMAAESLAGRVDNEFVAEQLGDIADDMESNIEHLRDELDLTEKRLANDVDSAQLESFADD